MKRRVRASYDASTGILTLAPRGRFSLDELLDPVRAAVGESGVAVARSQLWTLDGPVRMLGLAEIRLLASQAAQTALTMGVEGRIAIVAGSGLRFGVARQFQAVFPEEAGLDVAVFGSIADANDFLRRRAIGEGA